MTRSKVLKNRSFLLRNAPRSPGSSSVLLQNAKLLLLVTSSAFVVVTLFSQGSASNKDDNNLDLLEAVPRTLLAEIGEQSKSISNSLFSATTTATLTALNPAPYPPFDCAQLLEELKTNPQKQAQDPNLGKVYARRTRTDPSFYISVHNKAFDYTRWALMDDGVYYERALTAAFFKVLKESPSGSRVLDVGGNIGFFSLASAAKGPFIIDTFEPNPKNLMRYCESLAMNRWTQTEFDSVQSANTPKTNLYSYGVGQEEGTFVFQEHAGNPGMGEVLKAKTGSTDPNAVQIVTLDNFAKQRGWFQTRPDIAIFKVDVEGHEYEVMEGAKQLLASGLIRNVFMEISVREPAERQQNIPMLESLAKNYKLHAIGGWIGPDTRVRWPNDDQLVNKILQAADKEGAKQLNLWWKCYVGQLAG